MSAIADVITMLEAVRVEIAAEREAIDARVAEILAEAKRQTSALYVDGKDLETRDRMLVSAISTLHDVAARGRKADAGESHPSPRPSPTRGEGEEARAAAVTDCAIDAVAGAVAGEGGFAQPAPAESIAERLPGEPFDIPADILERNRKVLADFNDGRMLAERGWPSPEEDVDGRDAPGHDAHEIPAGSPVTEAGQSDEIGAMASDPERHREDVGPEGNRRQQPDRRPHPSAVASADGTVTAKEGPHPGPLPEGEGEEAAAVEGDAPWPEEVPSYVRYSEAVEGPHPGPIREGQEEDAPPALTPDERTVRAAAAALARPVTPEPVEAAPVELPPPAPARPVPAYAGVGVKAPSGAMPAAGDVVQVPLVDDKPAQPAESVYIAEGQRLADQIVADLPQLMRNYPQGPTVGELAREYEAPSSRVRDALNRLREQRRAVVHKAKKTGFLHLMPLGSRP